jgi:NAD+ synthase (glutamine-hydrolysing)
MKELKNLKDLKISLNQMPVIPGRPDLNAKYIIGEIAEAAKNNVDILAFPEMCVSGYVIGDLFEDDCFCREVSLRNSQIIKAVPENLTVIFGTLLFDSSKKGEDGRSRKYNGAITVNNVGAPVVCKTLQPNYRIFDDDRHFFSTRKIAEKDLGDVADYLKPVTIKTRIGSLSLGIILCEDMWHQDYRFNPTRILVGKGANIVFNLSASPWTWQKNRKRHQVVRDLLKLSPVPFVYVNNAGVQNNGKNIIIFDGSSTVYSQTGEIIFAVPPYAAGSHDFTFSDLLEAVVPENKESEPEPLSLAEKIKLDAGELYAGWQCAAKGFFDTLPLPMRKAVIGLSGGIDSAVVAVFLAKILGPENVYAINMPSKYNSQKTRVIAQQIATNSGINYEVIPIDAIVEATCAATGTKEDSLSYENVQARARMEILAAKCQNIGGVFTCNSNKIEMALGYGTMYGDIAGAVALLGDMLKREVYQMGDYLNRVVYQREVIPQECFTIKPSAELKDKQSDPFHYGSLECRGYHDELVRAFTEFRQNPEWVLEKYFKGTLETELRLEAGTLKQLFKTPADFVFDLEKNYQAFITFYFKRHPAPPVPILSKRAFGFDLRESMLSPLFTTRYGELRQQIISLSSQ